MYWSSCWMMRVFQCDILRGRHEDTHFRPIGDEGIRYTHMSVAAVCSPTRGSLLTGYNIHQIGTGIISEFATGYPGYNSQIDYSTPSIAKILTDNGYATAAFGKWHNTPMEEASPAGPFESWPTGIWGFEYFWGFLGGETNQFHPLLYENTTAIETPKTNADGSEFHLSQGMADQAIKWLDNWKGLRDAPFFMYYTPGAVHAPIQVPKEWRDKYKGQFDDGWHAYRKNNWSARKSWAWFRKTPKWWTGRRSFPEWDSFSEGGKRYLSRQMEVNAAFLEHVDHHIGRVIDHIEEMGELDNTLVIYLTADNGCTAEGTPTGTFSELLMQNGFPPLTMEQQLEKLEEFGGLDAWGGPHMANHYSVAWAYASSTPFPVDQADGVPFRRHHVGYGHAIPQSHQGERRMATAISECDRSRSHDSGSDRRSGTRLCERSEAKGISGQIAHLCLERSGCQNQPPHPVF
jgi:arylsulfatase A-like enzyme